MNIGIYRIVNTATNRTYIGSSINVTTRLRGHVQSLKVGTSTNPYLQASWNKHGPAAFVFEPLVECAREDLTRREQQFIDAYREHDMPLYNMKPSAESRSAFRYQMPQSAKDKISKAQRGNTHGLGRKMSQENKDKLAAANRTRVYTTEMRAKISARRTGKTLSPAHRAKISETQKGRVFSAEHRSKIKDSWIIRKQNGQGTPPWTPERRARQAARNKQRIQGA